MTKHFLFLIFLICSGLYSQNNDNILTLSEYLGYVKKYHPVVKQAQLITSQSEAKLLKARGGFDPKIGADSVSYTHLTLPTILLV